MRLAILFWIYKDPALCVDRARLLRRLNPGTSIFTLYGGPPEQAEAFERRLAPFVDDFYAFTEDRSADWKWVHGDQVIADWFRRRGAGLAWDTIFIAQWDLLMLRPVASVCANLKNGELLLPGLRPVEEVKDWWWWVRRDAPEHVNYDNFLSKLASDYEAPAQPLCCHFLAAALPRWFLERYASLADSELGFLEYKLPIYAQAWGASFCRDHALDPVWHDEAALSRLQRYMLAIHVMKTPIRLGAVLLNLLNPWGRRAFHPFHSPWPPVWGRGPRAAGAER